MSFIHNQIRRDLPKIGAANSRTGDTFFRAFSKIDREFVRRRVLTFDTLESEDKLFLGHDIRQHGYLAPISPDDRIYDTSSYYLCFGVDLSVGANIHIAYAFQDRIFWEANDEFTAFMSPLDGDLYSDANGNISNTQSSLYVGRWRPSLKLLEIKMNLIFNV